MMRFVVRPWRWIRALANGAVAVLACIDAQNALAQQRWEDLHVRMQSFLAVMDTIGPAGLADFFPRTGEFTYRRTTYNGNDTVRSEWRFPASDVVRALNDGPLWETFEVQWEGQRLGLFADQARRRRGCWRRSANRRFVPPGADATSAIYVDWRLEGSTWVISELADEVFASEPLPAWAFPLMNADASVRPELDPEPPPCTSR